MFHNSTDRLAT